MKKMSKLLSTLKYTAIFPFINCNGFDGCSSKVSKDEDDPSGFVLLSDAVPEIILEVRYYSTYNFIGDRIEGYEEPCILMTREAAEALKKASDELLEKGYRIKVFDAYRPQMAVNHFVRWLNDFSDTRMKEYFYPELDKSVLLSEGYIDDRSSHSRGSTIDLTLLEMSTGKEVDMGAPFDFFGDISHPSYTDLTEEQLKNRAILRDAMINNGFRGNKTEWWHYVLVNEPYPQMYFRFPNNSNVVKEGSIINVGVTK